MPVLKKVKAPVKLVVDLNDPYYSILNDSSNYAKPMVAESQYVAGNQQASTALKNLFSSEMSHNNSSFSVTPSNHMYKSAYSPVALTN